DRRPVALRSHLDTALIIDGEITGSPMADAIDAAAVRGGPLAAVVFTPASDGHQGVPEHELLRRACRPKPAGLIGLDSLKLRIAQMRAAACLLNLRTSSPGSRAW